MPPEALQIELATANALADVRAAYEHGRSVQRANGSISWPEFTDAWILGEIAARHVYRVLDGEQTAGVFSVVYNDELIWGDLERGAHLYLHRIARAPDYCGASIVDAILEWADRECRMRALDGLRMDTWASNAALIAFYQRRGFALVAERRLEADTRLATHYHGNVFALLERAC